MSEHAWVAVAFSLLIAGAANADEQMRPLAISGQWVAMAHHASMTAAPDMCMVVHMQSHVGFRRSDDSEDVEFRAWNDGWSLPAGVEGSMTLQVGAVSKTYGINSNTDTMVAVVVPNDDVLAVFAAMDKAASMSVTIGKTKTTIVSLSGSTKATNAFRTCAGIRSNAASPGSNPFQ